MIPAVPDDILEHIFSFLEPSDPLTAEDRATGRACCLVSKHFYKFGVPLLYDFSPSDPSDWCTQCRRDFPPRPSPRCLDAEGKTLCHTCFAPGRTFGQPSEDGHFWDDHKKVFEHWTSDTIRDVIDELEGNATVASISKLCRDFGARDPARQPLPSEMTLMLNNRIEGVKPKDTLSRAGVVASKSFVADVVRIWERLVVENAEEFAEEGAAEEADEEDD